MLKWLLFQNFRLAYGASRWLRSRFTPAGLLLLGGLVASGIFGVNTRQTLAYQVFALLVALLLLSVLCTLRLRLPLRVTRELPRCATAGVPLRYALQVANQGARREPGLALSDELENPFPGFHEFLATRDPQDARRNWFDRAVGYPRLLGLMQRKRGATIAPLDLPEVPPHARVRVDAEILPLRRGYLRFAGLSVARPDPLGLFLALQAQDACAALLVAPRLYRVPRIRLDGHRRYQPGGMSLTSMVGDSQEFLSLRDYRPGDPLRAIHWRSFARLGRPVVKEFHDEFFVRHGLVLDTFAADLPALHFEEAVSVAASFAVAGPDQDSLLDLMFIGERAYRMTAGRGLAQADSLIEVLACVQPERTHGFAELARLVLGHAGEMSGFICVFLHWDTARQTLVTALRARGVPVQVFVVTAADTRLEAAPGPLADQPWRLLGLPAGSVQQALDQIQATDGRAA